MSSNKLLVVLMLGACSAHRKIDVPTHLRAPPPSQVSTPYVVRMQEGEKSWQVALPPVSGGYEVRIPIGSGEKLLPPGSKNVLVKDSADYKAALARVQALFQRKSYDLALLELAKLTEAFPDDAKLAAMEGTIYFKMGNKDKAQKAWERAADLDPENNAVLDMLQGLGK
jgi:tetratricopeptide (TPR) repeat protein